MKEKICAGLGMLGGMLAAALGGWDTGLRVLLCLMAADFCTGLVNAAVFHRSPKTGDGRLDSRRCFRACAARRRCWYLWALPMPWICFWKAPFCAVLF